MAQATGNAKNILVGASPLFISSQDSTTAGYGTKENSEPGSTNAGAFATGVSYTDTLNDASTTGFHYRNVGYTNNGLQITYNPTYGSVTVDQLLDTAKLFKESMEVMIATEMSEGTLENVLVVFGQGDVASSTDPTTDVISANNTMIESSATVNNTYKKTLGIAAGALGIAPTERQLIAVGQAPTTYRTTDVAAAERVYYARRVLSVQQSQFSLARNNPTTFPVTFRLLPSGLSAYAGQEYGKIIDRVLTV
jgi:hypothetical protein